MTDLERHAVLFGAEGGQLGAGSLADLVALTMTYPDADFAKMRIVIDGRSLGPAEIREIAAQSGVPKT